MKALMNPKSNLAEKLVLLSLAAGMMMLTSCGEKFPEKVSPIQTFSQLEELFKDPPADFRSAPLWDWNHRISKEGIDFQMEQFKDAGIGGVFVHPRPGLITEYLSEEWLGLFEHTVQKGKELGMNVWIYDENSYPSGFAGGHVPVEMPKSWNQGSGLKLEIQDVFHPGDAPYEVILKKVDGTWMDITGTHEQEIGHAGEYYLFYKTFPPTSYWYGGYTYVDLLYPGVTEKFIEVTMTDGYEKYSSPEFGNTVKGVFTDEPNLEAAMERGNMLRWTPDLWEAFQKRWGYDLRVNLPSLVDETGEWRKVRHDYYELILELFVERWAVPWHEYCEEKGLDWTGHYWEHGWPYPTHGFDEAAFYIWHQQPGVDMLGSQMVPEGLGGQFGNTRAVRELASAANQGGHLRKLSETYGGGGWEMDFATYKRLVDWQGVLGVNFVNQHLSYYSLRGVRKFDYPPSFSYHEPWWEDYSILGDYIGRISLAGSSGEQLNGTLVLQPNTTAWMYFSRKKSNPRIDSIQKNFKHFIWKLERKHCEYDLGSELVIRTLGSVNKDRLRVGNRDYHTVVIPESMENLDRSTFELLELFLAGGGKILSFNSQIPYLDGNPSVKIDSLMEEYPGQCLQVEGIDDPFFEQAIDIRDFTITEEDPSSGELYHQRRILEDGQLLIMVNSSTDQAALASVEGRGKSVLSLDPVTGRIARVPLASRDKKVSFMVDLPPLGSAIYFISQKPARLPANEEHTGKGLRLVPKGPMSIRAEQDNILVINYLDIKSKDLDLNNVYFMDALLALFESQGLEMGNPWQHKIQYRQDYVKRDTFPEGSGFSVTYQFRINGESDLKELMDIRAVVEGHELWTVHINGHQVAKDEGSWWIDRDFHCFPIGNYLKNGKNDLVLKAPKMSLFAEIMPAYLTGPFLVSQTSQGMEISPGTLHSTGSWKEQGYPFYSQKVAYNQTFEIADPGCKHVIMLGDWDGTTAEVWVNGVRAGQICWPPYELEIESLLEEGENEITVKVVGSLKNTFGHFFRTRYSILNGPHDWNQSPDRIPSLEHYTLMDYGLNESFEVIQY